MHRISGLTGDDCDTSTRTVDQRLNIALVASNYPISLPGNGDDSGVNGTATTGISDQDACRSSQITIHRKEFHGGEQARQGDLVSRPTSPNFCDHTAITSK